MALPAMLIPILISAGLGLVGGAASAYQTSRNNQRMSQGAEAQQQQILDFIDRMYAQDTTSAPINAATSAIGGSFAASGLGGSGMNRQAAAEAAASITAQDLARKQGMEGQMLQNPVFATPDSRSFNPWADAFAGGAMGAIGGAAQAYGAQMSTEAGATAFNEGVTDWWAGRQGGQGAERAAIPTPAPAMPGVSSLGMDPAPTRFGVNFMDIPVGIRKLPR